MVNKNNINVLPFLMSAILGLVYVFFFVQKDPVLLVIFGLQVFRGGMALRVDFNRGGKG